MEPQALHTIKSRARFSKYRPSMGTVVGDSESRCVGCSKGCKIANLYMYLSIYQNFFSRHVALDEDRPKFGPFKVSCWIFDMPIDEKCTFGYGVIRDRLIEANWRKNVHFSSVNQELAAIASWDTLIIKADKGIYSKYIIFNLNTDILVVFLIPKK